MEITNATEPERVQIDLAFEKPWKARNDTLFTIAPEGSGSRVTWSITGKNTLMDQGDGHLQIDGQVSRAGLREGSGPVEDDHGEVGRPLGRAALS
jgi:hypothetical protein